MKIMITGVAGYFGHLMSEHFRKEFGDSLKIIGVDVKEFSSDADDVNFIAGDTRKKRIEDIFKVEKDIDAVIHLARDASPDITSAQSMMTNVYGTYHMMELCRKYEVGKLIFPSASIVYGAREENPALIREDYPLFGNRDIPSVRDRVEADMVCQVFARPDEATKIVILRLVPIWRQVGSGMLSRYMKRDVVPVFMGLDPMFQIIFDDEVLEAFTLAVKNPDASGAYNIHGKVFMPLSKVIKSLGKKPVPLPEFLIHKRNEFLWSRKVRFDFNYLKFPFCVDGARAVRELGYDPSA